MIAPEDRSSLRLDIDIAQQVGLEAACAWAADFVHWHTLDHRHSGIQYAGPSQGHESEYQAIPAARHALYLQAREKNPSRWLGGTGHWLPIGATTLKPERDCVIKAPTDGDDIQRLTA